MTQIPFPSLSFLSIYQTWVRVFFICPRSNHSSFFSKPAGDLIKPTHLLLPGFQRLDFSLFCGEMMRDRVERFVVLPISSGCASLSSVALGSAAFPLRKSKPESGPSVARRQEGEERSSREKEKTSLGLLFVPKSNISSGLQKLIGSIKNLSQSFMYKKEMEEEEAEMEIGYPTDVKHVTHIGSDGSATKCWDNLNPPEIFSFPSFSFRQFELAMASQATEPLVVDLKIPTKSQTVN